MLTFELLNNQTAFSPKEINTINDKGRRLFPQFLAGEKDHHTDKSIETFLPDKIIIRNDSGVLTTECFGDYRSLVPDQIRLANHVINLLWHKPEQAPRIKPVIDDRMYVVCWQGNKTFADALSQAAQLSERHLSNPAWYQFLFVDGNGLTCQHEPMLNDFLKQTTNSRWANYGTFYGATRYSFAALTDAGDFGRDKIRIDVQYLYLPMAQLCLIQRASVLHFSERISGVSVLTGSDFEQQSEEISNLYLLYIRFINRLYFREVTPQEQGIELYELMQRIMRIRQEVKDVHNEMSELNQFAELERQRTIADEQTQLSQIATIFLPATLLASVLGWLSDKPLFKFGSYKREAEIYQWEVDWSVFFMFTFFTTILGGIFWKARPLTQWLVRRLFPKTKA